MYVIVSKHISNDGGISYKHDRRLPSIRLYSIISSSNGYRYRIKLFDPFSLIFVYLFNYINIFQLFSAHNNRDKHTILRYNNKPPYSKNTIKIKKTLRRLFQNRGFITIAPIRNVLLPYIHLTPF